MRAFLSTVDEVCAPTFRFSDSEGLNAMTQENAADRAQNFNELDETTEAVESFAQDWLEAEGLENGERSNAAKTPRVVATLPDWSTFAESDGAARRPGRNWREILRDGRARTAGVALAAFGLGVLCASGGWRDGEKTANLPETAAVDVEKDAENGLTFEMFEGGANDPALATIDSSTLRSVPNVAGVGFETRTATASGTVSADWTDNNKLAENVGWADSNGQNPGAAPSVGAENGQVATLGATPDDSSWRRGVDFDRGLESTAGATASAERFPTWDDLETNVAAPSVEEILNSPVGAAGAETVAAAPTASGLPVATTAPTASGLPVATNAPVASGLPVAANAPVATDWPVAATAPFAPGSAVASVAPQTGVGVANNYYPSENVGAAQNSNAWGASNAGTSADYAAYNGGAGYQGNNGANLNGGASQFAGNSQNSGYNQANGSENFAGLPTATPNFASSTAPVPSFAAPTAPTVAQPPRAMVAQVPSESAPVATPNVPATNPNLRW